MNEFIKMPNEYIKRDLIEIISTIEGKKLTSPENYYGIEVQIKNLGNPRTFYFDTKEERDHWYNTIIEQLNAKE